MGDANIEGNLAHLNAFPFDETPVDLLFLGHADRSLATRQFIARRIKPSRIIAMHLPPADVDHELKPVREAYPYAVVFRQSAEQRALPIEFDYHNITGDYLGEPTPGKTPKVFARGTVSSDDLEHGAPVFSPDGNEVFWWVNRPPGPENKEWLSFGLAMRRENGRWSAPYTPEFSDQLVLSGDGRRAYFAGRLPRDAPRESQKEDVWVVERQGDGWSEPKSLNIVGRWPELRFAGLISLARNGALYFLAHAPDRELTVGVYRAAFVNGDYSKPELLPDSINMPGTLTWTPFIAPDESYLLFSSNRPGSFDPGRHPAGNPGGDIYMSRRLPDGKWTDPVNLGEPVNSTRQERLPGVSPDGKYLFFTRFTPGHNDDVYWVSTAAVPALKR
jgi:hypothetical protein